MAISINPGFPLASGLAGQQRGFIIAAAYNKKQEA
jgi:hypothetical protein